MSARTLAIEAGGWGLMNLQLSMKVGAIAWVPLAMWAIEDALSGRWRGRLVLASTVRNG